MNYKKNLLISGDKQDPLWPYLRKDLDEAIDVEIAVAFIYKQGLNLIFPHFQDLLDRGGQLRLLTGDYGKNTDPQALYQLLDLSNKVELRIFETNASTTFHPKYYGFYFPDGTTAFYLGSSNISIPALQHGIEWNYRVLGFPQSVEIDRFRRAFQTLFSHPQTKQLNYHWIAQYNELRKKTSISFVQNFEEKKTPPISPHVIQQEALQALELTRTQGNKAGLVVLATGLGKTWLSAFDSNRPEYQKILFVAHREEILQQAIATFRIIHPESKIGKFDGNQKDLDADILFASIQTLGRQHHLHKFSKTTFDYLIIDEFHHAAARTYRNLLDYFEPKFLLGLTATPERTDGGNLLVLCQGNLVYRFDLFDSIQQGLLCPFHYYGIPDEVNYENIPWRNSRFDPVVLTQAMATQIRAQNIYEEFKAKAGKRTLAFCCSQFHANFMADFFQKRNIRAVAVHSDTATSAPRATSLEQLQSGEIDIIFVVDMFNEGVDIPDIDTILMIRPTESSILFMQQLGRGFRKATNKFHLTIIDYIGNHQSFLNKPRSLLGLGLGDRKLVKALDQIQKKTYPLPSNCSITYELKAIDLIKSILDKSLKGELIEAFYHDYKFIYGQRPTAVEALYGGYNPRLTGYGSWFDFTQEMEGLVSEEKQVYQKMSPFLTLLEKLPETQSNKILLLLAMLGENAFPGKLSFDQLERAVSKILERTRSLQVVAGVRNLRENEITRFIHSTIAEWIKIENPHGMAYFTYENGIFGTNFSIETDQLQETFIGLVRELVEWRIMDSLQRIQHLPSSPKSIVCKVLHSKRRPILKLPNREKHPHIPKGKISVEIEGKFYLANFVKIAVNVIEDPKTKKNAITLILRNWFGKNAGLPGTQHRVVFHPSNNGYRLEPLLPDTINT